MKATKRKSLTKKLRFEVFKRDHFRCQYCGAEAPGAVLVIDHIHPVAKGGDNSILNLVTSCFPCNSGKSDRTLSDDSVVRKQREAIEHLAERREQIEMMLEWRSAVNKANTAEIDVLCDLYSDLLKGREMPGPERTQLAGLLKKHGIECLIDAMHKAVNAAASPDGVMRLVWCFCQPKDVQDAYRLRSSMRNRWRWVPVDILDVLKALLTNGHSEEDVRSSIYKARNWETWVNESGMFE